MEKIKRKSGTKYRESIWISGKNIKSPVFGRMSDARAWKSKMIVERDRARAGRSNYKPTISLRDFSEVWIEDKVKVRNSLKTLASYKGDLKNHILPELGTCSIGLISDSMASKLVKKLKDSNLSNKTINKVIMLLKTMLNDAVKWNYIPKSPLYTYPQLKTQERQEFFLTEMQIRQLLMAAKNHEAYPVILAGLNLGARLGELLGLCHDRVNLSARQVEITRNLTRFGLMESTKTHSRRVVPMNGVMYEMFTHLNRNQKRPDYVFCKDNGKPFNVDHFTDRVFKKILLKANLPRSIRFHDLRHTYASHFIMNDGSQYALQKILGHSSSKMVERYTHLSKKFINDSASVVSFGDFCTNYKTVDPYLNHNQANEPFRKRDLSVIVKETENWSMG